MRCIDADALVNTLKGLRALANILSGSRERPLIPFDDMVRMIEKSPTIDPVRKGKWLVNPDDTAGAGYYICDQCEHESYNTTRCCPNCGAYNEEGV